MEPLPPFRIGSGSVLRHLGPRHLPDMCAAWSEPASLGLDASRTLYDKVTSEGLLLLDGEVGCGLRKRVAAGDDRNLLPASILLDDPSIVRGLHMDYINAGAKIITTNTYATVRTRVESLLGLGDRWEEMVAIACQAAVEARSECGKDVLIAGSLPPLHGSYKPDQVGAWSEISATYKEHVSLMSDHVDLFLCETMTTAMEGRAAAEAARESGKPVWVSWHIRDDGSALLRSGETIQQAWEAVADLRPEAILVNCCTPESVMAAIPHLARTGAAIFGGYANGFSCIPEGWTIQKGGIQGLGKRYDLTPEAYVELAQLWLEAGARVAGGCCEVGPRYIAEMHEKLMPAMIGISAGTVVPVVPHPAGMPLVPTDWSVSSSASSLRIASNFASNVSTGTSCCSDMSCNQCYRKKTSLANLSFEPRGAV